MNNLSKTLFIPFYFKYLESIKKNKKFYDKEAVNFFSNKNNLKILDFNLIEKDINSFNGVISRTLIIDKYLKNILNTEKCNVFNIGCGLDFRNRRLGLEKINWFNIDLPEVIKYREVFNNKLYNEKDISANILETDKWDFIPCENNIFIFEGILMFFKEENVKAIIKTLKNKSKKSWFIIETLYKFENMKHPSVNRAVDESLTFKWGTVNLEKFAQDLGLILVNSEKMMDDIFDLESGFPMLSSELKNNLIENCRISLFKSL